MKLQRLTADLRHQIGIDAHAAHNMHVVTDRNINRRVPVGHYTVHQDDNTIKKITLYDNALKEEVLEKILDGYRLIKSRLIK